MVCCKMFIVYFLLALANPTGIAGQGAKCLEALRCYDRQHKAFVDHYTSVEYIDMLDKDRMCTWTQRAVACIFANPTCTDLTDPTKYAPLESYLDNVGIKCDDIVRFPHYSWFFWAAQTTTSYMTPRKDGRHDDSSTDEMHKGGDGPGSDVTGGRNENTTDGGKVVGGGVSVMVALGLLLVVCTWR